MGFQDVLLSLLIIAGIAFLSVGVVVLLRFLKVLDSLREEVSRFHEKSVPLMEKLETVADEASESLGHISRTGQAVESVVNSVKTMVDHVYSLEETLFKQISPSVIDIAATLAGVRRGLQTFVDRMRQPS